MSIRFASPCRRGSRDPGHRAGAGSSPLISGRPLDPDLSGPGAAGDDRPAAAAMPVWPTAMALILAISLGGVGFLEAHPLALSPSCPGGVIRGARAEIDAGPPRVPIPFRREILKPSADGGFLLVDRGHRRFATRCDGP